jgi:hypothetical protein
VGRSIAWSLWNCAGVLDTVTWGLSCVGKIVLECHPFNNFLHRSVIFVDLNRMKQKRKSLGSSEFRYLYLCSHVSRMPKDKNHLKAVLKEGGSAVLPLLKTIDAASGVFPPLKSAVSIALVIGNMVDVCFHPSYSFALIRRIKTCAISRDSKQIRKIGLNSVSSCRKP